MDESRYSTSNEGAIQGQVIGDYPIVHQHLYPTGPMRQQPQTPEHAWNIPYLRNLFFTGREQLLTHLHDNLTNSKSIALTQAINGLGGIGKTQTAIEYAYRYKDEYRYILWISAANHETLFLDYVTLASVLNLPEKKEQDQTTTVAAVKRWLETHSHWLLILDNADELNVVSDFLPTGNNGHILITTRTQTTGSIAHKIEVQEMDTEEGMLLLLRRAGILAPGVPLDQAPQEDRTKAEAIVRLMDGLPLALDQAGAYIDETRCSLADYLLLFRTRQAELLKRRGKLITNHPESVTTTLSISFEKVRIANPAAHEIMLVFAFLNSDAIPEDIFIKGSSALNPLLRRVGNDPLLLDDAISTLLAYSLLRRNSDHTLTVHRLVQAVLMSSMSQRTQRLWTERVIRAINLAFPEVDYTHWQQCQKYILHIQACVDHIVRLNLASLEAADLLMRVGQYLVKSAQYEQAEIFYQNALTIREQALGPQHPSTATTLHFLAHLYQAQGKYEQAEIFHQQELTIREKVFGRKHPNTAHSLYCMAQLYQEQGKYEQAESFYQRALTIEKKALGPQHPNTAATLHQMAHLYQAQGKYEQAESFYQRALTIEEQALGPQHPDTATTLYQMARLYQEQEKYEQAEPLYQRALVIREKVLGPKHAKVIEVLENYAKLLLKMGRETEAAELKAR